MGVEIMIIRVQGRTRREVFGLWIMWASEIMIAGKGEETCVQVCSAFEHGFVSVLQRWSAQRRGALFGVGNASGTLIITIVSYVETVQCTPSQHCDLDDIYKVCSTSPNSIQRPQFQASEVSRNMVIAAQNQDLLYQPAPTPLCNFF